MLRYSVRPRDIFAKCLLLKIWVKPLVKTKVKPWVVNIATNLIMPRKIATDALKTTSKWAAQETAEATGDLIVNKIVNKTTKLKKKSQDNSETVRMSMIKKYLKKNNVSTEERQIIDELRSWNIKKEITKVSKKLQENNSETVANY